MRLSINSIAAKSILTRTSGYLRDVASHSLQPYRGCSFGRSLCGVGCYVQHNRFVTRGERWGDFLDVKANAALLYRREHTREAAWARRHGMRFGIFMSSSTDPFLPHESRYRVSESILDAMITQPPDVLILQTHTHRVAGYVEWLRQLRDVCELRVHISIESDRDRLPGLPAPASSVVRRLNAAKAIRDQGVQTVVTVSPLLPISAPEQFFSAISTAADAVVVDHFIGGDGSPSGNRTARTELPVAMASIEPQSVSLAYRDDMVAIARQAMPGRVGVGASGFAGVYA
ncbi:MAG: radical SAM protein [Pseudomonadota bacterium]